MWFQVWGGRFQIIAPEAHPVSSLCDSSEQRTTSFGVVVNALPSIVVKVPNVFAYIE